MTTRRNDVLRGLFALVALVLLVLGVPLALVTLVGWPLPSVLPSVQQLGDALTRTGVSDATIVKVVACVVWFAWLRLVLGVAVEVLALLRRRSARRVPALGGAQRLAASLLSSVTLLVGTMGPARAAVPTPLAVALAAPVAPAVAPPAPAVAPLARAAERPVQLWQVGPRDTLWGIAEQALGRGERWQEIHRLNVGREVAPGVRYAVGTEVVREGWTLALPPDAAAPEDTVVVDPGDTLSSIAAEQYGDADEWPRLWEANRGHRFGRLTFRDPNLIYAGWEFVVPPDDPPAPVATEPPAPAAPDGDAPVGPAAPAPAPTPPEGSDALATPPATDATGGTAAPQEQPGLDPTVVPAAAADEPAIPAPAPGAALPASPAGMGEASGPLPWSPTSASEVAVPAWVRPTGVSGAVLLATGLAGLVAARRRQRLRSAAPGAAVAAVPDALARLDAAVRGASDALALARLDTALRALARALHRLGSRARVLAVVEAPNGDVVAHLDLPVTEVPGPWQTDPAGARVLAGVPLEELVAAAQGSAAPCPALVHLGDGVDGSRVHLDLEAIGALRLDGDDDTAAALGRAVLVTLAASPLADFVHVVTTEPAAAGFVAEERVHLADDADAAVELALELSAGMRSALDRSGSTSTFSLRGAAPTEPWEPVVVLLPAGEDARHLAPLVAPGGRGVAVVGGAALANAGWRLSALDDGRWRLDPVGLQLVPRGLAAAELASLGDLLAHASAEVVTPAVAVLPVAVPELPAWELLVRVVGPVDVVDGTGTPVGFDRSKALELVVWLTLHRQHPSRSGARTALWDADVRDATFANVVSDARRSLARAVAPPEGEEWIGRSQGERLPVHPLVRTDADLLAAHLARAEAQDDGAALESLQAALDLVRGAPFAGAPYLWPDGEGTTSNLVLLVTTVAAVLAGRCLERGDVDGVFAATATGLQVLPGHEELVCLRMEAHAQRGDLAGVKAVFDGYQRVVLADAWSDGQLATKVVATRNRLLREAGTHVSATAGG